MRSLHIKKSGLLSIERERQRSVYEPRKPGDGNRQEFPRPRSPRRAPKGRRRNWTFSHDLGWGSKMDGSASRSYKHQNRTPCDLWNGYERLQTILNHKIAVLHRLTRSGQPLRNRFQRTSLQPLRCCRILNLPDERSVPSVQLQFSDLTIQPFNDYHGNVDWPQPKSPRHLRVR
jgi:hypothetical protein